MSTKRTYGENENTFDRFGLDPATPIDELTARFRELVEDADENERSSLRAMWEEITLHPKARLTSALLTFPGGHRAPQKPPRSEKPKLSGTPIDFFDLAPLLSLEERLGDEEPELTDSPLDEDPLLKGNR